MKKYGRGLGASAETEENLKKVMRLFPQGVTVVTIQASQGPTGLTVSSFISVSLDPPLVLVSIGKGSDLYTSFMRARFFAVNFLGQDQKAVSECFAGRFDSKERFDDVRFDRGITGSPVIDGALAVIECSVWCVYEGGDHSLILGQVARASIVKKGKPLVYHAQRYTTTVD